jgi:hypothetical protein
MNSAGLDRLLWTASFAEHRDMLLFVLVAGGTRFRVADQHPILRWRLTSSAQAGNGTRTSPLYLRIYWLRRVLDHHALARNSTIP